MCTVLFFPTYIKLNQEVGVFHEIQFFYTNLLYICSTVLALRGARGKITSMILAYIMFLWIYFHNVGHVKCHKNSERLIVWECCSVNDIILFPVNYYFSWFYSEVERWLVVCSLTLTISVVVQYCRLDLERSSLKWGNVCYRSLVRIVDLTVFPSICHFIK